MISSHAVKTVQEQRATAQAFDFPQPGSNTGLLGHLKGTRFLQVLRLPLAECCRLAAGSCLPEKGRRNMAPSSAAMMAPCDQCVTPARMLNMVWLKM